MATSIGQMDSGDKSSPAPEAELDTEEFGGVQATLQKLKNRLSDADKLKPVGPRTSVGASTVQAESGEGSRPVEAEPAEEEFGGVQATLQKLKHRLSDANKQKLAL